MDRFAQLTGRHYQLFDYARRARRRARDRRHGLGRRDRARDGRGAASPRGEKVGVAQGPAVPAVLRRAPRRRAAEDGPPIAVLDRTKEPGAVGEPLYQDVVTALAEARAGTRRSRRCRGRRRPLRPVLEGIHAGDGRRRSSTSSAKPQPKNHFTVGIVDDVTHTSLAVRRRRSTSSRPRSVRAVFFGLGADGTVGANKNSIKIIGEETDNWAQGYFVYDSKKSGAITISHLRFGPKPIRSPYLISQRAFVACHQFKFLEKYDVLEYAEAGGVFLLNAPVRPRRGLGRAAARGAGADHREAAALLRDRRATRSRRAPAWAGASTRSCRPASSRSPACCRASEAIAQIKHAIEKTYRKRGEEVVQKNFEAVDATLAHLHEVTVPPAATAIEAHAADRLRRGARLRASGSRP